MDIGEQRQRATFRGGRGVVTVVAALCLARGCTVAPDPIPSVQPDTQAIEAVIKDAYGRMGQGATVFLSADGVDVEATSSVCQSLDDGVPPTCWPASARVTGDPGASITLGRFIADEAGRVSVIASYVQADGTGRGCTRYVLDHDENGWTIVDVSDAWPDCPISEQGEQSYHAVLARARSDECLALWANVGTCPWLYAGEGLGHGGRHHYFDPGTGLSVAERWCTDVVETGECWFGFGDVECEPEITETISCDR